MLKQMKTFIEIADSGSFHAAADRLCVSQSAVSMQMKNLEQGLKLELFDRNVRPPRINNTGRMLMDQMRDIVTRVDKLVESSPVSSQFSGSIRLGTIPGASFVLPDTLKRLNEKYQHLQVRVFSDLTDSLTEQVAQGKLDAALVTEPRALAANLISRPILTEPLMVLAAPSQTGQSDVELLENNRYISFNRKAEVSRIIEESMSQRQIKLTPLMELDTLETFQMMIMHGLGVGILPMSSIRTRFLDEFYLVPFGSPTVQRKISFVQASNHSRQLFLDTVYDNLLSITRQHRDAIAGKGEATDK